jgi:hypothetical protein
MVAAQSDELSGALRVLLKTQEKSSFLQRTRRGLQLQRCLSSNPEEPPIPEHSTPLNYIIISCNCFDLGPEKFVLMRSGVSIRSTYAYFRELILQGS